MRQAWLLLVATVLAFVFQAAYDPSFAPDAAFADPTPSGADPAYPLNHTFDSDVQSVGSPPANADFESSAYQVGTPPTNYDLQSAAQDAGTPPTNHDFETGDFTGWTRSGTTSMQSDGTRGYWAKLQASGTIITDAFTVDSSTQGFAFDMGYLSTSGYSWVKVYALTGPPTYSTSTLIADVYCNNCGYWTRYSINASAYLGQSIKLKFFRYGGDVGIDDVSGQIVFPGYTQAGEVQRQAEADGNVYAMMNTNGATLTSPAFTVASDAQFGRVRIKGLSASADQYKIYVLSGTGYSTSTLVTLGYADDSGWQEIPFNISSWQGQSIKIKTERLANSIGVDSVGVQWVDVPSWAVTANTSVLSGGPTGKYVRTDGQLTSAAFTLDANVQQINVSYKGEGAVSEFYLELLRGPDFSQVVDLGGGVILGDPNQWKTFKAGVSAYAGETVKLRLRRWFGWNLFDNAGPQEQAVPGWKLATNDAVSTGSDSNGTYVTSFKNNGTFYLRSADIAPGIIDRVNKVDQKYYAISYEIGYAVGSIARVTWYNYTGQNWVVFQDAADAPTGYRTKYFWLADFTGTKGYFIVQLTNAGKVYSIADNAARESLREPFSQKVGYRIDTSTGSFGYDDADIALEGRMPLSFTRYYNGHSDRFGTLGYRWSHTYDTRLEFAGSDVGVVFGSGGQEFFIWSIPYQNFSAADARVHDQLIKNGDGTYTFKTKDNLSYNFTSAGRLTSIVDLDSNTISFAYDANNRLTSVTDPDSRVLSLAYDANGKLSTLLDPIRQVSGTAESGSQCGTLGTGNDIDEDGDTKVDDGCPTIKYSYDANGDLTSVDDGEGGTRTFTYSKHRLASAVDQRGKTIFTNAFDTVNRVTAQTDPLSNTITINYDTPSKGITSAVDPLNNTAKFYFDTYHRTTDKVDPLGRTVSYVYDTEGNLQKVIDPYLKQWQFGYNSDADLTSATDPLGNPVSIAYNPQHLPTSIVDARGYITTMTYDANGNMTSVTDATRQVTGSAETGTACGTAGTGNGLDDDSDTKVDDGCPSTKYTYDSGGKMLSMINALGYTETYTYDANGNMATKTDALGKVWSYTHDAAGRKTSETNPLNQTTTYTYDLFGRPIAQKNALNQQSIYLYDLAGHLLMVEDPLGNQATWAYDDRGLAVTKTDPAGKITTYTYDGNRNMSSMTDPTRQPLGPGETGAACGTAGTGNNVDNDGDTIVDDGCPTSKYTYDANNRLLTSTDGEGGVTTYAYDNAGRVTSESDPLNRTTAYTYDDAGRVLTATLPNTGVHTYTYDANGNLLTERDPLLRTTSYAYDALNRRTSVTNALSKTTNYTYDPLGQMLKVIDPLLNATTYAYDAAGRMTSITDPLNHTRTFGYNDAGRRTSVTDALGRMTSYGYDAAGRMTSVTAPGNFTTSYTFDAAGRMTSLTKPTGGITNRTYDARGLLLTMTNPLRQPNGIAETGAACGTAGTGNNVDDDADTKLDDGCPSAKYAYDDASRRTSAIDALGRTTSYAFDDAGRRTSMTDALGGVVSFAYDLAGQQTSLTNPRGKTTTYTYDSLGNQLTQTDPLLRTQTNVYNLAGELAQATDARGVIVSYAYNATGAPTNVTYPGGTVTYAYDDAGRRTGMTDAVGTTNWYYDAASRVTSIVAPQGAVGYTYNNADQRLTMVLPGSRTASYGYDTAGRLNSIADWQSRVIGFSYNADGQRTGITRPNGVNSTYAYDVAGRLTSVVHAGGGGTLQSFAYTLDAVGNRTSVTSLAGAENYTLDGLNRLTNVTYPNGDVVGYTYDANGNRLTKTFNGAPTNYTYDNADQVTSDGTLTYTYDANGNTTAAGADTFTWDYANRMTGATVGGTASTYAYDGDDTRVTKTVGGTPTNYVWDREDGLPVLVDDGTNAYLHEDSALAQINGANAPEYLLGDALGSRRGVTNLAGTLTGTADYDTFGAMRTSTGAGSVFGYTGEQFDAETGYTYLRARYLNTALGRFTSADTVQPNAPGTQGYNLYAYVANNPTTWADPSGHFAAKTDAKTYQLAVFSALVLANPVVITQFPLPWIIVPAAAVIVCVLIEPCREILLEAVKLLIDLGSEAEETIGWTIEELHRITKNAVDCSQYYFDCYMDEWDTTDRLGTKRRCEDCLTNCIVQGRWPTEWCHPPTGYEVEPRRPGLPLISPFTITGCRGER